MFFFCCVLFFGPKFWGETPTLLPPSPFLLKHHLTFNVHVTRHYYTVRLRPRHTHFLSSSYNTNVSAAPVARSVLAATPR